MAIHLHRSWARDASEVTHGSASEALESLRGAEDLFVNPMSDLFHENLHVDFLDRIIAVIERAAHHNYQVLTKRPKRVLRIMTSGMVRRLPDHVWIGVSIESSRFNWGADVL
jgi:protein gp37